MAKMGAPEKQFDWNLVDSLAAVRAELLFVAERMLIGEGMDERLINKKNIESKMQLINRRLKKRYGITYVDYCKQKEEPFKIKLLQKMKDAAMKDNNITMMIWLSKQYFGFSDKVEKNLYSNVDSKETLVLTTSWREIPKDASKP